MAPAPAPASPPVRSDVPLALWPCAQPDPHQPGMPAPGPNRALLPAQLAGRIVAEYTQPGALLIGPACAALLSEAARLDRRAVALTCDLARARQTSTMLDLSPPAQHRQLTHICRGSLTDAAIVADLAGQAHALVTVNLDGHGHPATTTNPASLAACAALLRPGGLLIAVSSNQQQPGRLVDLAAQTIRAAEQAGLAYLQHVVALVAPVQAGRLSTPAAFALMR